MGRVLGGKDNKLEIYDPQTGESVEFAYRQPTTSEYVGYSKSLIKRKGNKIEDRSFETRVEFALKIVTDIRKGDLIQHDGTPLTAKVDGWKELMKEHAPDLLAQLAFAVFEGARVNRSPLDENDEEEDGGEAGEGSPLEKSSDAS